MSAPPAAAARARSPKGFTLVEMMIVVAMIGILTGLAFPSISDAVRKERARSELSKVVLTLDNAREHARTTVCRTLVAVDASAGTLTVGPDPADTDVPCQSTSTTITRFSRALVTIAPFKVSGVATNPLVYSANGGLEGANVRAQMDVVQTGRTTHRLIEVWPATGTVRLK